MFAQLNGWRYKDFQWRWGDRWRWLVGNWGEGGISQNWNEDCAAFAVHLVLEIIAISIKADTYSARTENVVLSPRAARTEWHHFVLAALVGEFSQLVLDTSSGQNFVLVPCLRTIVWLVNLKWAWLMRFPPARKWRVLLWAGPLRTSQVFCDWVLVEYEMSWPEPTLFLFSQPWERVCSSLYL